MLVGSTALELGESLVKVLGSRVREHKVLADVGQRGFLRIRYALSVVGRFEEVGDFVFRQLTFANARGVMASQFQ